MTKDMTNGNPGKRLIYFAVPMVLGNLFQQLYNIVDSMVVGKYVGSDALAAVGASASITFLFVAIATGLSIGASVVISQYFGARKLGDMKTTISTVLVSSFVISFILMIIGISCNEVILRFMNTPEKILVDASKYLSIYFSGLVFLFMYNTLTAVFNALGNSKTPLFFLALSSAINVVLDLVFVINLGLGVAGVAYATLIAQGVSAVLSFIVLIIRLKKLEIKEESKYFSGKTLATICRVAIPSTIQQSIVSIGMLLVQSLINRCGSDIMAGYTAATKIDSLAILPMVNVGNAMSTFTAQNIGAKKPERIKPGLKAALLLSGGIAITVSAILFIWGDVFIGGFIKKGSNYAVMATGMEYLRVVGVCYIIMGTMNTFSGILRGAGDIKVFMLSSLCNLSTRVIVAYSLFAAIGERAIWYAIPLGWFVGLVISFTRYKSGKWVGKQII